MPPTDSKCVWFRTPAEKAKGLIGMDPIPEDTLFVFDPVYEGVTFHSNGVLYPFFIAFLDEDLEVLDIFEVMPPHGTAKAPPGTVMAVEWVGELS